MVASVFASFQTFDPKTGVIAHWPYYLGEVVHRARRILIDKTSDDINAIASNIDDRAREFVDEYVISAKDSIVDRLVQHGGWELSYLAPYARNESGIRALLEDWPYDSDDPSPTDGLGDDIRVIDTVKSEDPNEFATLALWKAADSIAAWGDNGPPAPTIFSRLDGWAGPILASGAAAVEAMEAVCVAERLAHLKHARSGVTVRATEARHRENRQLKAEVWKWCEVHLADYSSIDAAASEVARRVVPMQFRTVQRWISQFKKAHTVSAQSVQRPK
jgi:hypothetical protein